MARLTSDDASEPQIAAYLQEVRTGIKFRVKRKRNQLASRNYARLYYQRNKERFVISATKRQNQKRGVVADLGNSDWDDSLGHFNHQCAYCGGEGTLQKEHVVPVSRGGSFSRNNIVPSCIPCNQSKKANLLHDWYKYSLVYSEQRLLRLVSWIYGNDGLNQVRERLDVKSRQILDKNRHG